MTQLTPSYYQDLNTLVRFLTREGEGGYVFAVAEHQGMIPQINDTLLDKVRAQGKSIYTFGFDLEAEETGIMEQLREHIARDPAPDGLIIKNLDDCLRQRGTAFLQELNFSREALHQLNIPLVFWVSKGNLALISNQAADLFSQRRLTTVIFEAGETLLAKDGHLESRFNSESRNPEDYEALTLKVNLLKKQLHEAEAGGYTRTRIARDIALPLATTYSELDLHQPALELLHTYADALPEEDADKCIDIADIYFNAKHYENASNRYRKAIEKMETEGIQNERLSYTYTQIGDLYYELGNFIEAESWFTKDLTLSEKLEQQTPTELLKNRLAISYERLGDLWQQKGDFNQALLFFEKRAQLGEQLYLDNPHSETLGYGLCIAYERLGDLWKNKGEFDKALEFFEKLNELIQKLYFTNPHHELIKNELAISYAKLGTLWQAKGDFNQALLFFEKDAELTEQLYRDNPHSETLKNGLAISYSKLGDLWQAKGDFNQALQFFEKEADLFEELYRANPHNENLKNGLAISYSDLGDLWQDKGDFNQALAFFEKYNQHCEELYRANSHNENLKNGLTISYNKLGLLWLEQNELEKALPYLQQDLQLTEEIAIANPQNMNWQNNLCYSWRDLGEVLAALDRNEEALPLYEKAAAGWQVLWEQTELPPIKEDLDGARARIEALRTGEL